MKKLLLISIFIIFIVIITINIPYVIEAYRMEKITALNAQLNKKEISRIPVLMYHHITEDENEWDSVTISPEKFREEMLYLKLAGYNTIHFKDYIEYMEQGKDLPDNPIIITFDDGYLSNYQYAYPVLKNYDMKASIFIIGWSVGKKFNKDSKTPIIEHFTWEQAKEMYNSGLVEIQSHTYDLHNLSDGVNCGLGVSKLEIETAEQYIKRLETDAESIEKLIYQNLGIATYVISYPYGSYNEYSESVLKDRGYRFTVTTKDGISDFSSSTYLINRINMPNEIDSRSLIRQLLIRQKKNDYLPYKDEENYEQRIKRLERLHKVLNLYRSLENLLNK